MCNTRNKYGRACNNNEITLEIKRKGKNLSILMFDGNWHRSPQSSSEIGESTGGELPKVDFS